MRSSAIVLLASLLVASCAPAEPSPSDECPAGQSRDASGACIDNATCAIDPCDHGTCAVENDTVVCHCDVGWAATTCDACDSGYHDELGDCVVDESCATDTCSGAGLCGVVSGIATCDCDTGYAAPDCATCDAGFHRNSSNACVADESCAVTDPCAHGMCDDTGGVISCECETGYAGSTCAACDIGYGPQPNGDCTLLPTCEPGQCEPYGVCDDTGGIVSCTCDSGYFTCDLECREQTPPLRSIDVRATNTAGATLAVLIGQTFTATRTGHIVQLDVHDITNTSGETSATYRIMQGASCPNPPSCTFLAEQVGPFAAGTNTVVLTSPVRVVGGEAYAWQLLSAASTIGHRTDTNNLYPGGRSFAVQDYDLPFTIWLSRRECSDSCSEFDPCGAGTCADAAGLISCDCPTGYSGTYCESCGPGYHQAFESTTCVPDETCEPTDCAPGGSCDDSTAEVVCACGPGAFECDNACPALPPADVELRTGTTLAGFSGDAIGQSFVSASSGALVALEVHGVQHDPLNQPPLPAVTVSLHLGGVCSGAPCNAAVRSQTFALAAGTNTFAFAHPVQVTALSEYTWKMTAPSQVNMTANDQNDYAGGRALAHDTLDQLFSTYVTDGSCR